MLRATAPLVLCVLVGCRVGVLAPDQPVEIVRDDLGFTHVYAKSDRDAMFAAGYAQARDRLLQMELVRRQAYGKMAELVGESGLRIDRASRTMDFARWGRADADRAQAERPEEYRLLGAWVGGVNRRISEHVIGRFPWPFGFGVCADGGYTCGELGFQPRPWTIDDVYVVGKLFTFGLSSTLDNDILASVVLRVVPNFAASYPILEPTYDTFILEASGETNPSAAPLGPLGPARRPIVPLDDAAKAALSRFRPIFDDPWLSPLWASSGSNNWAVSGRHTDTGKPYVVGDPHQPVTQPNRLWPIHLSTMDAGGTFDVIGYTFGGTPFVELGHTRTLGWTATTNFADAMDLWDVETVGDTDAIRLGGRERPLARREETILVRRTQARFGDADAQTFVVRDVPGFGVLLPDEILPVPKYLIADNEILFNWTGFSAGQEAGVWLALDRAKSIDDFERAIDLVGTGAQNFTAADANEISYRVHADVPDRGPPSARPMPWHIVDGNDPATLWTRGLLGSERMPRSREPQRGILFSANNDPFGFTADGVVENDPFYWGGFYAQGFRARRLEERLGALVDRVSQGGPPVSRVDMEDIQHDRHSLLADRLIPALLDAVAEVDRDPTLAAYRGRSELAELAGRLDRWDRRWTRSSHAALVFVGFSWFAARRAFAEAATPQLFDQISERSPPFFLGGLASLLAGRVANPAAFFPEGRRAALLAALDDTAVWLRAHFGSIAENASRYGDLHVIEAPAAYPGGRRGSPREMDGASDTLFVAEGAFFGPNGNPRTTINPREVPIYRMVIGFDSDGTARATTNYMQGASETPGSPFYDNAQNDWIEGVYRPLPFRRPEVDGAAVERWTLDGR